MNILTKNIVLRKIFRDWKSTDNLPVKILIGVVTIVLIAAMFPRHESIEFEYEAGSVWTNKDFHAPFSFAIVKDAREYEKERQEALRAVYPVFERRSDIEQTQGESLSTEVHLLQKAMDARMRWIKTRSTEDSLIVAERFQALSTSFSPKQWNMLTQWKSVEKFLPLLQSIMNELYRVGIIDSGRFKISHKHLAIRKGVSEEIIASEKLYDPTEAMMQARNRLFSLYGQSDTTAIFMGILRATVRPNIRFNQDETRRAIQIAQDDIPRSLGYVQEGELVVSKYETITDGIKLKLDSFRRAKADLYPGYNRWLQGLGIFLHIFLVVGLYGIYLFLFRKRIFRDNTMLVLIALLILMESFFAFLSHTLNVAVPLQYLILVPTASMLLAIIFDSRVAFYGTVTMALIIGGIRGNDYSIAVISLIAGAIGVYTVRDISNRTQIFRSLIFILLAYAVSIVALGLERFESPETIGMELLFALTNAVVSPVLTYGLLIFFEKSFNVTTDLTLIELSDFNHPLLRELSEQAPGTFHHSMTLGNLAEAAAESIGANAVLTKVGAYYHDVGKIVKSEYFVENQTGSNNKHKRMRPRMSARVIIAHVQQGIELARKFGLPEKVIDFIAQHHGTTRNSYFYDKALKQAAARDQQRDTIRDEDYRYPGPKPQSKETGILMLADLVEASTRTMTEITPQKLEHTIDNLIRRRFIEGQLDECDLTIKDLRKIREAFLKIVIGIHHQRIIYPEQESQASVEVAPAVADENIVATELPVELISPTETLTEEPSPAQEPEPPAEPESAHQ